MEAIVRRHEREKKKHITLGWQKMEKNGAGRLRKGGGLKKSVGRERKQLLGAGKVEK